jgi:futalosine hydrolase
VILLACAVEKELPFWTPRDGVEVLITGVGVVEAAIAVTHRLAQQRYKLVVNAGIAGAYDGVAKIGSGVVVSSERLELDREDGTAIVLPDGQGMVDTVSSCDPLLGAKLAGAGFPSVSGMTVSRVTTTEATAQRLAAMGAQVETMEGFAVMRAAELAGIHTVEVRGISNRVGDPARSGWNFVAGVAGLQHVLTALFMILDAGHQQTEHQ